MESDLQSDVICDQTPDSKRDHFILDCTDSEPESEIDQLRCEIRFMQQELSLAVEDKIRAAEYGLQLLEEKEDLEKKVDNLESLHDKCQQEIKNVTVVSKRKYFKSRTVDRNI